MIIDSFMFGNEYELPILEIRLAELYDTVSYFILIESNRTQTGLEKPFYFKENESRFKDWSDKIVSVQLDASEIPKNHGWSLENWQRQQILVGLDRLQEKTFLSPNDILMVSDSDEIPEAGKLKEVIDSNIDYPTAINLRFNNYYLDYFGPYRGWWGSVLCPLYFVSQGYSPQYLRNQKDHVNKVGIYEKEWHGWHFSNLGGLDVVWEKAKRNVEPMEKFMLDGGEKMKEEYRKIYNKHVIDDGYYLFLDNPGNKSLKLEKLDHNLLPGYVKKNIDKYKHLLYPEPLENL
jgi:beta-1,4-mannosyl-glycoprotein beta-1,4-N-acetylglucosaminyltransferase